MMMKVKICWSTLVSLKYNIAAWCGERGGQADVCLLYHVCISLLLDPVQRGSTSSASWLSRWMSLKRVWHPPTHGIDPTSVWWRRASGTRPTVSSSCWRRNSVLHGGSGKPRQRSSRPKVRDRHVSSSVSLWKGNFAFVCVCVMKMYVLYHLPVLNHPGVTYGSTWPKWQFSSSPLLEYTSAHTFQGWHQVQFSSIQHATAVFRLFLYMCPSAVL